MKPPLLLVILGAFLLYISPLCASAQELVYPRPAIQNVPDCVPTWTWSDSSCWYVSGTVPPVSRLPQNGENASVLILNTFTLDTNTANLGSLTLGSGNVSLTGTFLQPGSTLTAASEGVPLFLVYQQNGGTNNPGALTVAGTYNLQGANSTLSATSEKIDSINLGPLGNTPAVLNQMDGKNTVSGTLALGANPAIPNGRYNLSGGELSAGSEVVGNGSTGTFTQTGGTNAVSGTLTLGNQANGDGHYELEGTGILTAGNEVVGNAGAGFVTQAFGSPTLNSTIGTLTLGAQTGGSGTYALDVAGNDVTAANEVIGDSGTGAFNQDNNSDNKIFGTLTLGKGAGGSGTYALMGGTVEANTEIIGGGGAGTFQQNGGTNSVTGNLGIGSTGKGSGTYTLSDSGTLIAGSETLGNDPCLISSCPVSGTFNQSGGGNVAADVTINFGTYNLSGGSLQTGTFNNNGMLNLSGTGALSANSLTVGNSGVMTLSGSSLSLNVALSTTNNGIIIENGIGPGAIIKWGAFTGNARITIDPATNDFLSLTMSANGFIQATAGSQFIVSGNFVNNSTQNTLWDTGAALLDFTGGGTHTFDLAGQNGAGFSNNFAWGALVIDPGNTLDLAVGSGDALYAIMLQGLVISGNTITNIDGTPGLFLYYDAADNPSLNGNYNLTGGGELIAASGPAPTPEPSTWLLMASGLTLLMRRRGWAEKRNSRQLADPQRS